MGWLCFFAFACQSYSPKTLDPQVTAGEFGKRSLEDPGLRSALIASGHWKARQSWPPAPWGLRPLQGAGLHYSPDIAVAKAQAQSALAAIGTADTTPNPSLAFAPELGTSGGVASPWVLGFSLNFPIETAGKRQLIVSQARALGEIWSSIMIPAIPALAYPKTVRFTLTAFPYPVSPSAIQGIGSLFSSRAALESPSATEEAAVRISP